jgi:membrane fusion protein, multidrug efflux system
MKLMTLTGCLLILMTFVQCKSKGKENPGKEKPPPMVDVLIAGHESISSSVEVNGTVLAFEMVDLHPEISGRITYLNIPDGTVVQEGTILARINDAELQAQLDQQKSQLDLAQKTEKRLRDLLKINGVNQADYDAAINQVNILEANIKITNALIDKTIIRAPFSGKLGLREVSPGAYVTPQTILGTLQQSDRLKIDFTVPETQASLVKPGNKIRIQLNGSKEIFNATISAIEPQMNATTRNIKARALLTNNSVFPGSFVKVMLDLDRDAIVVPTNAIIPDALANQVVVVENGKATFRNVETGFRNANIVEISSGVTPGDSIVVSGMLFVRPNAVVKVKKIVTLK